MKRRASRVRGGDARGRSANDVRAYVDVLVDPAELEHAADLMLATARTPCSAHQRAAGPYR